MAHHGGVPESAHAPTVGYYPAPDGMIPQNIVHSPGQRSLVISTQLSAAWQIQHQVQRQIEHKMEHQVEHQTSCRSRSDFTHPGEQSNAYETVTLLDDSLQGSNLDEQPFQSLIQPNATNEHHDNYQHAADMTTERTAPLTTDPPSTPLTSHDRSSSFINRRASPTLGYDFVIEDPTNPLGYREKRFRSRTELDKQKEDIRHLKEYGGACLACHRSKKKCGPSTPCPPCLAHDRKCVRKGQTDSQPNSSDPVPSPNPHQDELLEILQPCPWELTDSIDGTYCDPGFIQNSSRQGRTDR